MPEQALLSRKTCVRASVRAYGRTRLSHKHGATISMQSVGHAGAADDDYDYDDSVKIL